MPDASYGSGILPMIVSSLEPGVRLGHYRIIAELGAGGMGLVYLAEDERLKRNIALKILPDALVHDEDRLRRFVQEAQTASALNHPSIVTIYEIGSAHESGREHHYIAMELIDGTTLREAPLNRSNLRKMLEPIIDIAEGLAKAHAAGVVHRDLKPENVMLTGDGRAKIVDFGLAKLLPLTAELSDSAPTVALKTGAGVVMGTVGYMSPEQVEARAVDHRSDIFSLGCVLYEVVTGARAFAGASAIDTLHAILHDEPQPAEKLHPGIPGELVRVIDRCLRKDPDERFQSVKEIAIELRAILRGGSRDSALVPALPAHVRPQKWRGLAGVVTGAIVVSLAVAAVLLLRMPVHPDPASYRFTPLETTPDYEGFPAWSPDGKTIAYAAETKGVLQIFTRSLTSTRRAQVTNQARDAREPFWSPDGTRIFFISTAGNVDALWSAGAAGGTPQLVMPGVTSAAISPDGSRLALLREEKQQGEFALALWFSDASGANVQRFVHPEFKRRMTAGTLRFSPDGRKLGAWLFMRGLNVPREFWEISIPDMKPRRRLEILGQMPRTFPFNWMPDSRRIVFGGEVPGELAGSHLWIADTATNRLQALTATPGQESYPAVSPDGKQIVFTTEETDFDLIEIPLDGKQVRNLLATSRAEKMPAWAPDGDSFAFITNRSGVEEIWLRSGNGEWERPLVTKSDFSDGLTSLIASITFSPDGQRIAFQRSGGNYRVWISSLGGGAPVPLNRRALLFEDHPTWSPDGEWMAFTAYPSPRPGPSRLPILQKARVGSDAPAVTLLDQVVVSGEVKWSPTGEWIACETFDGITLVSPDGARKRVLAEQSWYAFDWSRDGKAIYAIRGDDEFRLLLVRVDVATGDERIVLDLGPAPPTNFPFQGLSVHPDEKKVVTSAIRLRGDLWLFEGFEPSGSRLVRFIKNR